MVKQKIYFNGRFLGQRLTGVQRYALEVIKALDLLIGANEIEQNKYEFTLLIPSKVDTDLSLKHIQLKKVGPFNGQLWEQFTLPFFTFDGMLINLCNTAPIFNCEQVVTIHDASASANKQNFSFVFRTWYQLLHHILPKRVRKIFTVSNFSKEELLKYYPIKPEQIEAIHIGIDHLNDIEEDEAILKTHRLIPKQYILAVSSFNPNKNFSGLVEALQQTNNHQMDIVIVGDKNNPIYNKTSLIREKNVHLVGYVSDAELRSLYRHAKCFIFPSYYEGFGLPPLEAMLLGCPVIASNVASMPEVLQDAVLYCDPTNTKNIAQQVDRLLDDEQLQQVLVTKGYIQCAKYTWKACAYKLFKDIEEVL